MMSLAYNNGTAWYTWFRGRPRYSDLLSIYCKTLFVSGPKSPEIPFRRDRKEIYRILQPTERSNMQPDSITLSCCCNLSNLATILRQPFENHTVPQPSLHSGITVTIRVYIARNHQQAHTQQSTHHHTQCRHHHQQPTSPSPAKSGRRCSNTHSKMQFTSTSTLTTTVSIAIAIWPNSCSISSNQPPVVRREVCWLLCDYLRMVVCGVWREASVRHFLCALSGESLLLFNGRCLYMVVYVYRWMNPVLVINVSFATSVGGL